MDGQQTGELIATVAWIKAELPAMEKRLNVTMRQMTSSHEQRCGECIMAQNEAERRIRSLEVDAHVGRVKLAAIVGGVVMAMQWAAAWIIKGLDR